VPAETQTILGGSTGAGQTTSFDRSGVGVSRPIHEGPAVRPVDGAVPDAGSFGSRQVRGCGACSTAHRGTDFAAPAGTPIVSVLDGVVAAAGPSGGYGTMVLVQHSSGLATRYAHMSSVDVRVGETVRAGDRLGAVGSTGVSTGPHLHFEVLVDGAAVDPLPWLRARGLS
jgi:murein DD-endopeptidase MepM/ murein hydrolase activator NlpD